jgi:hypothetical protein
MKWTKTQQGTTRVRSKFLFFPTEIGNKTRWFEFAVFEEKFCIYEDFTGDEIFYWAKTRWLN